MSKKYHAIVYGQYSFSNFPSLLVSHLLTEIYSERNAGWLPPKFGSKVLDVGCGLTEQYVVEFREYFEHVVGIDSEIDFNKDNLPYGDNEFDIVFTKSTIEHVYNTEHFLTEIKRVLKPNGILIVLAPSWEFNYRWFYDDFTHIKPFHRKGLQDALRISGFKDVKVTYHYHLPFIWKHPILGRIIASIIRLLPDDWRWKDFEQQKMNVFIRFCKEVQLLGVATK